MANNLIQIKRSLTTANPASLANGELAFTANGDVLFIGSNSQVVAIGGKRVPGTLTANQALVANATSGIDKIIVANASITSIYANSSSGTAGQYLTANGAGGIYWNTPAPGVAGSDTQVQFNDGGSLAGDAGLTYNKTTDTLSTNNILATSTVNAATLSVGTSVVANTTRLVIGTAVGLQVNGTIGTAGQILYSNGTTGYWAAPPTGDITAVTAGSGLTGGGTSGDVTLDVGAGNGITVAADTVSVDGANGISVDASGVNVLAGSGGGLSVNATGVWIVAGSGLLTNATGLHVGTGNGVTIISDSISVDGANGISVDASGVNVLAGTGVTVNATGVHIGQSVSTTSNVTFANIVTTDLTTNGNTTLGSNTSDVVTLNALVTGNVIPTANNTYYIGNNTSRWAEGYFGNVHVSSGVFAGSVQVGGDLVVTGNVVTTNVASVIISDPLIYLAGNNYSSDLVDIGFAANYNDGVNRHTGLFRDATDGIYKLFNNLTQELSGSATVNVADPTFAIATLNAYLTSGGLNSNSSAVTITANSTVNVNFTANTLTLSTALVSTSGGTGFNTYTSGDLLVANTGNALSKLSLGTSGYVLQSNGTALIYDTLDGGTF
jgi:hypothetical protein